MSSSSWKTGRLKMICLNQLSKLFVGYCFSAAASASTKAFSKDNQNVCIICWKIHFTHLNCFNAQYVVSTTINLNINRSKCCIYKSSSPSVIGSESRGTGGRTRTPGWQRGGTREETIFLYFKHACVHVSFCFYSKEEGCTLPSPVSGWHLWKEVLKVGNRLCDIFLSRASPVYRGSGEGRILSRGGGTSTTKAAGCPLRNLALYNIRGSISSPIHFLFSFPKIV